jgi:hypothetical protein
MVLCSKKVKRCLPQEKPALGETEVKASARIPRGFQTIDRQGNEVCLLCAIKGLREQTIPQIVKRKREERRGARARKPWREWI